MQIVVSDHDCEGQAEAIFDALDRLGLLPLIPMELRRFRQVGLSPGADDEVVWQFCQQRDYFLLTGNRSTKDDEQSLEQVMRRLVLDESLPVLTISNLRRVKTDWDYCQRCAERLATIVLDKEKNRGIPRLFLPG